jgi:hypothetical protein
MSATVNRYLDAVTTTNRRGRKLSESTLEQRLAGAQARFKSEVGVKRLLAAQEIRDLRARLKDMAAGTAIDIGSLEAAFVKVAKRFSEKRGVTYAAWRDAGVPAPVLKKAGIRRARG